MQGKDSKERDCLSFEGFCACVRIDISHRLKGAEVAVQEVIKNNGIRLHGLVIREHGSSLSPTIYLEQFYRQYQDGMEIGRIENIILDIYRRDKPPVCFDEGSFLDWNQSKKRVVFRLVNREMNMDLLGLVPHVPYLDLDVIFVYRLEGMADGSAGITIYNSHLDMWGVTVEDLYDVAKRNTSRLLAPVIQSMDDVLKGMCEGEEDAFDGMLAGIPPMYVLTNRYKYNGAVGMLYKEVLGGLADSIGCGLYILPSSIHELILVPMVDGGDEEELNEMVRSVNAQEVAPDEVLSDHVYRYIRETGEITM